MQLAKFRAIAGIILVANGGCMPPAPPTATAPMPRDVFVGNPADTIWARLLVVLPDLNLPVENMDKASWFMRTQETRLSKQDAAAMFDCGTEMGRKRAGSIETFARVTILLRPAGDSTGVRVQVAPRGFDAANARLATQGRFVGDSVVSCVSLGRLESRIIAALG